MSFQRIFESSENTAVFIGVAVFIVFHFGMLYLFDIVQL